MDWLDQAEGLAPGYSQMLPCKSQGRLPTSPEITAALSGRPQQAGGPWHPLRTGQRGSGASPGNACPQRTPAFHDLLQFHLQGLDGSRWVIASRTLDPVNGELPISRCSNVIILEEDDPVGVFYDSAGTRKTWVSQAGTVLDSCRQPSVTASPV